MSKGVNMFFRLKKSGLRQYLQIVESYRDKASGSPRQRVLLTLGRLDQLEQSGNLEALLNSLSRFSEKMMVITAFKSGESTSVSTRKIGPSMIFERLWKELSIKEVLEELLEERRFEFNVERAIFITVLHRLMISGSDRGCNKWRREHRVEGVELLDLHLHHLYRAMQWLGEAEPLLVREQEDIVAFSPRCTKDIIEEKLYLRRRNLYTSLEVVFFDTTSIYFEGEGGYQLGRHGNSKDHRPDLKQLVVGVILDNKGHPLSCEIWPGNTTDVKTLIPIVKRLRKRFHIGQVCIVSDRGMVSREVIEWLESEKWSYIIGVRMRSAGEVKEEVLCRGGRYREVKQAPIEDQCQCQCQCQSEKKSNLKVKEVRVEGRRYIVCLNEKQAEKDSVDREAIITALACQIKQGAKSFIGNQGYRKYLKNPDEKFEIDYEKIRSEARYDGKWVLRTNTNFEAGEVALKYKELWMVEDIFRSLKSVVETRPVYHRSDEAIRGHIFCSFLALVMIKEIKERLEGQNMHCEWDDILQDLDALEEIELEQNGKRFILRSQTKGCCSDIFKAVGIALPQTIRQIE
jgi:transposase